VYSPLFPDKSYALVEYKTSYVYNFKPVIVIEAQLTTTPPLWSGKHIQLFTISNI